MNNNKTSNRYFVFEPRNCYGEILFKRLDSQPHYDVKDRETLVKTVRLPFHEVPKIIHANVTYNKAIELAAELNRLDYIDMAYAINI